MCFLNKTPRRGFAALVSPRHAPHPPGACPHASLANYNGLIAVASMLTSGCQPVIPNASQIAWSVPPPDIVSPMWQHRSSNPTNQVSLTIPQQKQGII